jgi:hypothetical protein
MWEGNKKVAEHAQRFIYKSFLHERDRERPTEWRHAFLLYALECGDRQHLAGLASLVRKEQVVEDGHGYGRRRGTRHTIMTTFRCR